jgi:5-methylcytosine-specific restriction enzyme subunit McrC
MTTLTLTEHKPTPAVALTGDELDALVRAGIGLNITPTAFQPGRYDIAPGSSVGAVALPHLDVVIQPKIGIKRLLFMISYAAHRMKWRAGSPHVDDDVDVLDAIALLFCHSALRATERGLLRGYRRIDHELTTIRGRIRMGELVGRRLGRTPPIDVSYDVFTADIAENRVLLTAAELLRHLPLRSQAARDQVSLVWRRLAVDVESDAGAAGVQIDWHRLNRHYRPAVELGQLLLRNGSVAIAEGGIEVPSFVVNMNEVFEDFVVAALRDAIRARDRGLVLDQGAKRRGLALDAAKKVRLEPDISVWRGPACVAIADVKYKRVNATGVKHPDLYQLLSYLISTDLRSGVLIYAKGESDPALHEVVNIGRELEVVAVDLEQESDDVLDQIDVIAERLVEEKP